VPVGAQVVEDAAAGLAGTAEDEEEAHAAHHIAAGGTQEGVGVLSACAIVSGVDVLADLLGRARASGALFARTDLHGSGGVRLPATSPLSLHVVSRGRLCLETDGVVTAMDPGDVVLVRAGTVVSVLADEAQRPEPLDVLLRRPGAPAPGPGVKHLRLPGDGEPATLLCGAYELAGSVCERLTAALPPVVHVPASGRLGRVVALLVDEVDGEEPGQQTALDRLLDLLLVHVLRAHFAANPAPRWYAGTADPAVGPALRAMHTDPAHAWTVEALARVAGLSRAAFARRFALLVGEPPLTYLTGWRMALAQDALRRDGSTLAAVAREVGYGSEFALSAAFTRHVGEPPSRWRSRARAAG
jgi:AraC-like DNA-binding protein